jgi:hypothetical protein
VKPKVVREVRCQDHRRISETEGQNESEAESDDQMVEVHGDGGAEPSDPQVQREIEYQVDGSDGDRTQVVPGAADQARFTFESRGLYYR